jgi:ABC-type branched-subunit amino acid transport system substrate-binding protein
MKKEMKIVSAILSIILATAAYAEPVEVKLGATLPLTGRLSFAGVDIRRGMELAIEEFSSPEVKFTAVFEDNQHEARQAASSAQKLLEIDKVDAVISMWDMADVVAPIAERHKTPHISIRWDPGIAEKFSQTMTVESTYRSWVDSALNLLKSLNAKSVAAFTEEGQGWILAADYFKAHATAAGITVTGEERVQAGTGDFRSSITRGLRQKPDYVIFFTNPPVTENLITTLKQISPTQKFTGYFEVVEDKKLIDGVPFVAQFEVAPWFAERFTKRYGEPPRTRAAQGYDIIKLVAATAKKTHLKPSAISLATMLRSEKTDGASGPLFISGDRTIESACVWKVARGGVLENFKS